jgi:hypothetical protein
MYILVACLLWATPILATDTLLLKRIEKLEGLEGKFKDLAKQSKHKEDSLQRELLLYKTKESYYNTILGFQAGVFFTIVSVIASCIGLISWRQIHRDIRNNREYYQEKINELKEDMKEIQVLKKDILEASINVNMGAQQILRKPIDHFFHSLEASKSLAEIDIINGEISKKTLDWLKYAYESLSSIGYGDEKRLNINKIKVMSQIKYFNNVESEELQNIAAKIKVKILTLTDGMAEVGEDFIYP